MKILITGGAGFIGVNLVDRLLAATAHEVHVLDDLSVGQTAPGLPEQVRFTQGDFTDPATLERCLVGMDAVVHLAAQTGVIDSIVDPQATFDINVAGTFRLLEMARRAGVRRIINASTGGALLGEVTPPIDETMPPSPLSPYGASKLAVEGYCSAYAASYGLACASLRFSNIYGPRSGHKKSVVAAFVKNIVRGEPLTVYGDGSQNRDYLYVGDLAKGICAAIEAGVTGAYQLGSGRPTTLTRLLAILGDIVGRPLDVRYEPARPGEVHSTWCAIGKAQHGFRYDAPTGLDAGLEPTYRWFADHPEKWMHAKTVSGSD